MNTFDPFYRVKKNQMGAALPTVLLAVLIIIPSATFLLTKTTADLKTASSFRKLKTASSLANNVVTDLLRQFSQTYQADHYSTNALDRNPAIYSKGSSSLDATPNTNQHFVYFTAKGSYDSGTNEPSYSKTIDGVIKFISDLTTYGTMWNYFFTTSADNATYVGKVWANAGWRITGNNVVVQGGPVFVNGNISTQSGGDIVINGDLYRSGSLSGNVTVNGTDNNWLPPMVWPTLDSDYFDTYSNVKVTANTDVRFNHDGVSAQGTVTVGTITYTIPTDGFIIYGENCTLTSSGTLRGRVTIASIRTSGSVGGRINIDNDLQYATAGSTSFANVNDSFAAVSSHRMTWTKAQANRHRYISGVYFIDNDSSSERFYTTGGSNNSGLKFFGTRNKGISGFFGMGAQIQFDTQLDTYPPPGLPEKPNLVTWYIR